MKKLLMGTIASIALISGTAAIAQSDNGFNSPMAQMFMQYHDLTDQQQGLTKELFDSGKLLANEFKKSKPHIRAYIDQIAEKDEIDVEQILAEYKNWQQGVDKQFEVTLRAAANLHANLSVEQRQKILASIKAMRAKHGK